MSSKSVISEEEKMLEEISKFSCQDIDWQLIQLATKLEKEPFEIKTVPVIAQRYDEEWKALAQVRLFARILVKKSLIKEIYTEEELYEMQEDKECCILQKISPKFIYYNYQFYQTNLERQNLEYSLEENQLDYINDYINLLISRRHKKQENNIRIVNDELPLKKILISINKRVG